MTAEEDERDFASDLQQHMHERGYSQLDIIRQLDLLGLTHTLAEPVFCLSCGAETGDRVIPLILDSTDDSQTVLQEFDTHVGTPRDEAEDTDEYEVEEQDIRFCDACRAKGLHEQW